MAGPYIAHFSLSVKFTSQTSSNPWCCSTCYRAVRFLECTCEVQTFSAPRRTIKRAYEVRGSRRGSFCRCRVMSACIHLRKRVSEHSCKCAQPLLPQGGTLVKDPFPVSCPWASARALRACLAVRCANFFGQQQLSKQSN